MKKAFKGYYKLTDSETNKVWETGFVSLDTNVLLNFYRYSEETRKELFKVMNKFSSKLWLSHHVAYEFHKNRIGVISGIINDYDATIKSINEINEKIIANARPPHVSEKVVALLKKSTKLLIKDLLNKHTFYESLISNDTILNTITAAFNTKIGNPISKEEHQIIEKEGQDRFKLKIPPGYKDDNKNENKYGDLIIWKDLISKSKKEKRPFILIIDDSKEDWWLMHKGKKICPRHELSQELYLEANQSFLLYIQLQFLEIVSKKDEEVNSKTLEEVKEGISNNLVKLRDRFNEESKINLKMNELLKDMVNSNSLINSKIGLLNETMHNKEIIEKINNYNNLITNPFRALLEALPKVSYNHFKNIDDNEKEELNKN